MNSDKGEAQEALNHKSHSMPVAGGLLSLIGWSFNTLYVVRAALAGPLIVLVAAMSDAPRSAKGAGVILLLCRFAAPLALGSLLVFAGRRMSGKRVRPCLLDAIGAAILPPVIAALVLLAVLR